jgi:hypothetical protein
MKLTDPSRWPPGFGPIRFERRSAEPSSAIVAFAADGSLVAELDPLDETDGALALDGARQLVLPLARCWALHVIDGDGHILETHVLCPSRSLTADARRLFEGLRVWATLTVLAVLASDERPS